MWQRPVPCRIKHDHWLPELEPTLLQRDTRALSGGLVPSLAVAVPGHVGDSGRVLSK